MNKLKMNEIKFGYYFLTLFLLITSCTKSRKAELAEDDAPNVYEISFFGQPQAETAYEARYETNEESAQLKVLDNSESAVINESDVNVPERIKFMFKNLPIVNKKTGIIKITFSVDKNNITAYKVVSNISELTLLEKSLSISLAEAQLMSIKHSQDQLASKKVFAEQKKAALEREQIKSGLKKGVLLVPLFKYEIAGYGIIERVKNELKENTSQLRLKETDWENATHIKISSKIDARKSIGLDAQNIKIIENLYNEELLENRVSTAQQLSVALKVGLKFIPDQAQVITKLSADSLLVYEISNLSQLNSDQLRVYREGDAGGQFIKCNDETFRNAIDSKADDCVTILVASVPISYKQVDLSVVSPDGSTNSTVSLKNVTKLQGTGLVHIEENSAAKQLNVMGLLDPNSSIKISDLQGEFLFRRTFEDAATSFLGRTGTSGDMAIVKFELEEDRIVIRNQVSLIKYTGQGAKDREEVMSFPVRYFKIDKTDSFGTKLVVNTKSSTTKDKADYLMIDWTQNQIPDTTSPLAFFDDGSCFISTASQKIVDTEMKIREKGVLSFSISSSHTVNPSCATIKDVNSAYWANMYQLNFNIKERISFRKYDSSQEVQVAKNISPMAQEAFNFGVFTLADKVNDNGILVNSDGSEKYMPMIHDLRNGRVLKWYLGGINNSTATDPERRQLLVEAAEQVVKEWNQTFSYSFKGTPLERESGKYLELIIEEPGQETGRLGDLDKNYIWFNEIPADNGLLGVAQPAANPRTGTIESANVIVYTGNAFENTNYWIKMTELSRNYEKQLDTVKAELVAELKKQEAPEAEIQATPATPGVEGQSGVTNSNQKALQSVNKVIIANKNGARSLIKALGLESQKIKSLLAGKMNSNRAIKLSKNLKMDALAKGGNIIKQSLPSSSLSESDQLVMSLTNLMKDSKFKNNDRELERRINDLFLAKSNLSQSVRAALNTRQRILDVSLRFDKATMSRPGCTQYTRNDVNDIALNLDSDPKKNMMLNFKINVMSTLSHELGHAFGLLHNFKGSVDKDNFEFPGENTGRNYSSIMDYTPDVDQFYSGPGPYDAHAIRAAYTNTVEVSSALLASEQFKKIVNQKLVTLIDSNKISIDDYLKITNEKSLVHLTKNSINPKDLLKFYEQCSDGGIRESILCAQFDIGSSATEIIKNKIADYNRSYITRNYIHNRILFGQQQEIQVISRNIRLFSEIRSFLDETIRTAIMGAGQSQAKNQQILNDLVESSVVGYRFFQELIRTPTTNQNASLANLKSRLVPVKYTYLDADNKEVQGIKLLEARAEGNIMKSAEKIDTIGIGLDKIFALDFLMATTDASTELMGQMSVSYKIFEQIALGVEKPQDSLIVTTLSEILSHQLSSGFFAPNGELISLDEKLNVSLNLESRAAISSILDLMQSQQGEFDAFAETFKIGTAYAAQAPTDRLVVAAPSKSLSNSNTIVYFALQNDTGAGKLIREAASNSVLIKNKTELYQLMQAILANDLKPETIQKADQAAAELANALRALNTDGLLMTQELDAETSPLNFEAQVKVMRQFFKQQLQNYSKIKTVLQTATPENEEALLQQVVALLGKIKSQNEPLDAVKSLAFAQGFLINFFKTDKILISGDAKKEITGDVIMQASMTGDLSESKYDQTLQVLNKLSVYTNILDKYVPSVGK
jgi:Met-zincin